MDNYQEDTEGVVHFEKNWASDYILGPLHSIEPSQESATRIYKGLPTPPASASRPNFPGRPRHGSRSSRREGYFQSSEDESDSEPTQPYLVRLLSRSSSGSRRNSANWITSPRSRAPNNPSSPPLSPERSLSSARNRRLSAIECKRSVHTSRPPPTYWNQGTILARANSVASSHPTEDGTDSAAVQQSIHRRGSLLSARHPGDSSQGPQITLTQDNMVQEGQTGLRRGGSLRERFPGDPSVRPLAQIKREQKLADRQPHLHNRHRKQPSDLIDSLDLTGPGVPYHHDGPFDAALQSRNRDKKYSPLEAVKDSNREALRATPHEYIQDSLERHVPLQGTAVVPPGVPDRNGRELNYEEGADLMREPGAPGGPFRRWDGIQYLDEDLRGKGEPSFTIERERKEQKARLRQHLAPGDYEMLPTRRHSPNQRKSNNTQVRQRSVSNVTPGTVPQGFASGSDTNGEMRRSNTTGKNSKLQSIKSALGSIRRRVS